MFLYIYFEKRHRNWRSAYKTCKIVQILPLICLYVLIQLPVSRLASNWLKKKSALLTRSNEKIESQEKPTEEAIIGFPFLIL